MRQFPDIAQQLVNSGRLWKAAALAIPIQVHTQEKDPHPTGLTGQLDNADVPYSGNGCQDHFNRETLGVT